MATKVVVCPECESPLQPGRFSCSSCGAVLAAVATVVRSFAPPPAESPVVAAVPEDSALPAAVEPARWIPPGWSDEAALPGHDDASEEAEAIDDEPDKTRLDPDPRDEVAWQGSGSAAGPVAASAPAPPATTWPE